MPSTTGVRTLWWASTAALVAVLLRLWHAVLMKEAMDAPIALGGWIGLAWLIIAAARACETRDAAPAGAGVPRLWTPRSPAFWTLLAVFSVLLLLFHVGFERAASDGRGYFAQLNSIVMDRDLDFSNNIEHFAARPGDAAYPLGTALMWAPFFVLAHAWLGLMNLLGADYLRDGYWNPYQRAVGLGTFVYGFAALVLIGNLLRRHFDGATALVSVVAVLMATPVVWYLAVDSSMSHGVSLFAATSFLVACLGTRGRRTARHWWLIAGLTALMALVRPQNLLFLAVLGVEGVLVGWTEWRAHADLVRLRRRVLPYGGPFAVGLAMIVLMLSPSGGGSGDETPYMLRMGLLTRFHVLDQLFAARHGVVSSSPILGFALLGLPLLAWKDRVLGLGLLAAVAAQIIVNGTSSNWTAGASFGARRFVECALPFAFGLAAVVDLSRRRPLVPVGLVLAGLIGLNLALVQDVRRGVITLSEAVTFDRMAASVESRVGNPASLPAALLFAWTHDLPIAHFDRMHGLVAQMRVDVGNPTDEGYLAGGWLDRERDNRYSFRWATEPEAVVAVRLRRGAYTLRFIADPFTWPGAPPQTAEIRIGRSRVAAVLLTPGYRQYEVEVPESITPPGELMRLSFRFAYARSPQEVGVSRDPRRLAARFALIEMVPRDGEVDR